ncbi:Uncharacterised protein [Mycobacterium tuberculosis]|nr:Uncharacterised protein [Mycobacterium tuberculosis]
MLTIVESRNARKAPNPATSRTDADEGGGGGGGTTGEISEPLAAVQRNVHARRGAGCAGK